MYEWDGSNVLDTVDCVSGFLKEVPNGSSRCYDK